MRVVKSIIVEWENLEESKGSSSLRKFKKFMKPKKDNKWDEKAQKSNDKIANIKSKLSH